MNAEALARIRPERMVSKRYAAFRVAEIGRTYALPIPPCTSEREALDAAVVQCFHKDHLVIKEVDEERGTVALHVYAIKRRSQPVRVYRDHAYHSEHLLYAAPLCVADGGLMGVRA